MTRRSLAAIFLSIFACCLSCSQTNLDDLPPLNERFRHHSVDDAYAFGDISAVFAGDIDRDGYLDIVVRSGKSGESEIAWYKNPLGQNSLQAGWRKFRIAADAYPSGSRSSGSGLLVHDVNNDSWPDIITGAKVEGIGNALFWWESPVPWVSDDWIRHLIAGPDVDTGEEYAPHNITVADIDQDGTQDLVIAGSSNQGVHWTKIPVDPTDSSAWDLHLIGQPRGRSFAGLAVGDIDDDGRIDIVHADVWYKSSGPLHEPVWNALPYGLINFPPSHTALHDLNGDKTLEILVSSGHHESEGSIFWYEPPPGGMGLWQAHRLSRNLAAPESLALISDAGSGNVDVITAELDFMETKDNRLALVYSLADLESNMWLETLLHSEKNFRMIQTADLDGDKDLDLYGISFTESNGYSHIDWFENISNIVERYETTN